MYDAWFPLQMGQLRRHRRSLGAVRLRYSVTYVDGGARLRSYYLTPFPQFVVGFRTREARRDATFALLGRPPSHRFSVGVMATHVADLVELGASLRRSGERRGGAYAEEPVAAAS